MFFDPLYLLFLSPALLLTIWAQFKVKTTMGKFSKIPATSGYSGAELARAILNRNGLDDVNVEMTQGWLSDHYDPRTKTLRLSPEIYHGRSLTSMGVAAHETGHAIQHGQNYGPLVVRQTIAPAAIFGSNIAMFLLMIGFIIQSMGMITIGIAAFAIAVLFTLITLPVEFNASKRALAILSQTGIVSGVEERGAKAVLDAAALTYVAAALTAIMQLLYFLLRAGLLGGRSND